MGPPNNTHQDGTLRDQGPRAPQQEQGRPPVPADRAQAGAPPAPGRKDHRRPPRNRPSLDHHQPEAAPEPARVLQEQGLPSPRPPPKEDPCDPQETDKARGFPKDRAPAEEGHPLP